MIPVMGFWPLVPGRRHLERGSLERNQSKINIWIAVCPPSEAGVDEVLVIPPVGPEVGAWMQTGPYDSSCALFS
jgi:hypothetical protein